MARVGTLIGAHPHWRQHGSGIVAPAAEPVFSMFDMADAARGHAAFTETLTLESTEVTGRVYDANDAGADDWDEKFSAANGNLSRVNAAPSPASASCITSAGGTGDVAQLGAGGAGARYWLADTAGTWDIGSNDFIAILFYKIGAASDVALATTDLGSRDGIFHYTGGSWQRWFYAYDTTSSYVALNQGTTSIFGYCLMAVAIDRSRSDGIRMWFEGKMSSSADPSTLSEGIGDGNNLAIFADSAGNYNLNGGVAAAALYQASGWLDLSDTTEIDKVMRLMHAQLYGHAFTTYQGSDGSPTAVSPTKALATRTYDIDGTSIIGFGNAMAIESADGTEPYVGFVAGDQFTIPAAEIPTGGEWTIDVVVRKDGNSGNNPFCSISDGTTAEHFEMGFDSSGNVYASSVSASGDNGSATSSGTNFCDGDWHTVSVAAKDGALSVKVDGNVEATDASTTMPTSPDTFIVGANGDLTDYGVFDIRYGDGYGLQVYDEDLH